MSSYVASAAPVIDGVMSPGEWGAPIKTYTQYANPANPSGAPVNIVSTYWDTDANNVYGAIHLDSGTAQIDGANIYVYSSTSNINLDTNQPGTYGDGNDVLVEGVKQWSFGEPNPPYAYSTQTFPAGTNNVYTFGGVTVAHAPGSDTVEFSIAKSLLGNYDSFRYGGQLFSDEFHTGSGDPNNPTPGALAPANVPEPASLGLLGVGLLAMARRRRV